MSLLTERNYYNTLRLKFDYIIVDEAHHSLADTYIKLFELFPEAKKLGVTATPWRLNHESLAYIATYIIPILSEAYSSFVDCFSIFLIMYVVYMLYVRSKLLLVNPILNMKYSIFNIKYRDGSLERQGILISKDRYIEEYDKVKIYNVGYQLFYGIKR